MMLPIVQIPQVVEEQCKWFDPVFTSNEQRKHFREYVTGLIVGQEATVTGINQLFLGHNDQSALNKFVTIAEWDENELNRQRVRMEIARLGRRPISTTAGRLIIDDTLAHHTQCKMEGLAYLWDHAEQCYTWAHNVVTSYYVNRSDQFPVDFRLWYQFQAKKELAKLRQASQEVNQQPDLLSCRQYLVDLMVFHIREQLYRTKTSLAAELVQEAVQLDIPFSVVLFDSWFLHNELIDAIEALHKDWVGGCPKDRLILFNNRWIQLQEYLGTIPANAYRRTQVHEHIYWTFTKTLTFKSLRCRKLRMVASFDNPDLKGDCFLVVTHRRDWERTRILLTYHDRWPTETFNEDVKGDLGFEDYQLHKLLGIRRHWYLCLVAYSLLGEQGYPGRSRQGVRAPFESTGQRCHAVVHETLGNLVQWIAQQLKDGVPATTITQMLLA
jgi:hypothetical protein